MLHAWLMFDYDVSKPILQYKTSYSCINATSPGANQILR
jgi:hypothetical protein